MPPPAPRGHRRACGAAFALVGTACALFFLWILAAPAPASAFFSARVVGVIDGDTVKLLRDGATPAGRPVETRVRLYGIDAPEKRQAFGTQAKKALSDLVFGRTVRVDSLGMDRYARMIARLSAGPRDVNVAMVSEGFAWHYRRYAPRDAELARAESEARAARRGLWQEAAPEPPWEFRAAGRAQSRGTPASYRSRPHRRRAAPRGR